jgi:hypothetical protein
MNRTVEPDTRLPNEESKTVLLGKDQAVVLYRLEKQDMTATLSCMGQQEPVVVLALGSEARNFSFSEFIHFWLTMIEVGLKRDIAELECGKVLPESTEESVREV